MKVPGAANTECFPISWQADWIVQKKGNAKIPVHNVEKVSQTEWEKWKSRTTYIYCCWHKGSTLSIENVFFKQKTTLRLEILELSFPVISKITELKVREMLNVCLIEAVSICGEWWWGVSTKVTVFTCDQRKYWLTGKSCLCI